MANSNYEPSREEIERACEKVREEWTDKVYRKRAGGDDAAWTPRIYHVGQIRSN
jgi:hypothetical protein